MRARIVAAVTTAGLGGLAALGPGTGADAAPASTQRVEIRNGGVPLPAIVARPAGNQRFPAVVLVPRCRPQPERHVTRWLQQLQARGVAGIAVGCRSSRSRASERTSDAFAALAYLRSLSYVSPKRVAVMGWSGGANASLAAVGRAAPADGFRAAVAFYPDCRAFRSYRPVVPARVLTAAKDPLAAACKARAQRAGNRFQLTVYRGAHRSFDETSFHDELDKAARKRGDAAAMKTLTSALASATATRTIFDPDSWVTAPLTPNAPLDPDQSPAAALRSQVEQFGTWVNTTEWSAPLYVVPAGQPRVRVEIDTSQTRYTAEDIGYMAAELADVPLPPDAEAAGPPEGTLGFSWIDHELIVYQPETDTAWELYHLLKDSKGRWSATAGGKISNVSRNMGNYDPWPNGKPHGITGYGLPMLIGLQRLQELKRGTIDHVVGVSIPHVAKGVFRSPGVSSDGEWTVPDAVPEGTRFRLPADLDIDALPLTPYARIVAKAVQAHGLVIVDRDCRPSDRKRCPAVTFKAEDPRPRYPDPYAAILGSTPRERLFDNFPWDKLQVLAQD